ncbi:MAG: hypothetical protein V2I76_05290 [Roseobacter sp.]|jgi:hypothetical protein|nr:hypothetical protein [Roseobacter sp.]
MIDKDDVRAAVGAGILTEAQAASLTALSHSRRGARENLDPGDEPFELFKGFNEIFIVVGLIILTMGWVGIVALGLVQYAQTLQSYLITTSVIGAVVLWGLGEYFIRRRRMVAPAIALTVLFAGNAVYGFISAYGQLFMLARQDYSSLPLPFALATFAILVFWFRFRVPFALAIIALSAFLVSVLIAANSAGAPANTRDLFLLSADGPFALITLVLGILVFVIAMAFDMSDPHRVTRRSANGFWLHVVAAPALVNTIALSLLAQDNTASDGVLFGILAVFALIAIIIDRRSFLIAAIGYIVILSRTVFDGQQAVVTIFLLGVFLVLLGARWERIRAALMAALPGFIPRDRLPPST